VTLLLLIRHGMTDATGERLTGWTPGIHLSERGREQSEKLVERLAGVPIAAIYSSPLERCRETAAPLAAARRLRVREREELGEVRFGAWTGRSLKQLARTRLWRSLQRAPSSVRFPDGESLTDVHERMIRELGRIAETHPNSTVAVFSHGDPIRLAVAHFAGMHVDLSQRLAIETASISVVAAGGDMPRILKVNDTGELDALGARRTTRRSRRRAPRPPTRRSASPRRG
jgi:probable phosphoglycerate mutase